MNFKQLFKRGMVWSIPLFISACSQLCQTAHEDMSAEDVLKAYLDLAFNMSTLEQKEDLMDFTAGSLKAAIAGATDETITEAYLRQRYQLLRFSIVERHDRTPRETEITYQLLYRELDENEQDFEKAPTITTENTVSMIKEKRKWYIQEVLGNRTKIEFPITEMNEIKPESEPEPEPEPEAAP